MNNEKELKRLKASYEMYQKTIDDTKNNLKNEPEEKINSRVSLIETAMEDVLQQYISIGGVREDLEKVIIKEPKNTLINIINDNNNEDLTTVNFKVKETSRPITEIINQTKNIDFGDGDVSDSISYDVIPLPSKGECYKNKISNLKVSYLVGADEDIISSPNLYRDGLIMDILLRRKVMNKNINVDDLLRCDRDAVILWLRANGYGPEFPVTATDPDTGVEFETIVDLTAINFKPFSLVGDENGYFDFKLPVSGDNIKFKFLTHKDEKNLELIDTMENNSLTKMEVSNIKNKLESLIKVSEDLSKSDKETVNKCAKVLDDWYITLNKKNNVEIPHSLTNRMELSIISINDNTDRMFINKYVKNMRARDSFELRRYINENTPGMDYNITVKKPESLGGGSLNLFLSIDEYVFLNVT